MKLPHIPSRREFLNFSAVSLMSALISSKTLAQANDLSGHSLTESSVGQKTPDQALRLLLEGNKRYTRGRLLHPRQSLKRLSEVAKGQHPFAIILGCADSRVAPEVLFDQGLGDLFVVRVAGNIASDDAVGSIEFAVEEFKTSLIVVLGHERCGAVKATLDVLGKEGKIPGHIGSLVEAIRPVAEELKNSYGDVLDNVVTGNVKHVVQQLMKSEILNEHLKSGSLKVIGARYDLDDGNVLLLT